MMRALFVCPNLDGGGAERHWSILVARLRLHGIQVSVATLDGRGQFFSQMEQSGVPAVCFADRGRRAPVAALRSLRASGADVIVTRGTSAHGLGMLATRTGSTKWVVNWHRPDGLPLLPRRALILRRILPLAAAVIAVSDSQISELCALGVRKEAIQVIHNGTDVRDASIERSRIRRELDVSEPDVVVLLAGRLETQKRVDLFIESIALAQRDDSSIVGLVAGDGPLERQLRVQAAATGADVRFLGRREDMPEIIAASDALAVTSEREALPYIILEAMAGGLPIVATSVGAIPEVVTSGVGITVPPGDPHAFASALRELAADSGLRSILGAGGQARQRQLFSAEAMCESYAAAILRVGNGLT